MNLWYPNCIAIDGSSISHAALTNCHQLGAWKQRTFIVWYFCRLEVLTGLKTKVSAGLNPFLGAPREHLTPGLFPLLEASRVLWLMVPPSSELAVAGLVPPKSHQSDALFCLPLPLLRTPVITSGNLLILRSVWLATSSPTCHVLWVELCPLHKMVCWSSNSQCLRIWLCLGAESLEM